MSAHSTHTHTDSGHQHGIFATSDSGSTQLWHFSFNGRNYNTLGVVNGVITDVGKANLDTADLQHTHTLPANTGAASATSHTHTLPANTGAASATNHYHSISADGGSESRSINITVKLWKRTA